MKEWSRLDRLEVDLDFGLGDVVPMGTLATAEGMVFFQYDEEFLNTRLNPSPMTIKRAPGLQVEHPARKDLTNVFGDSPPDGWTKRLIDLRVRAEGYDPQTLGFLDRLAFVGNRGIGALSYRPPQAHAEIFGAFDLDDIAAIVRQDNRQGGDELAVAERMAGSLGGLRPKAHILSDGHAVSFTKAEGLVPWIVKFPHRTLDEPDSGAAEHAYALMARAAGIAMPPTALLSSTTGPGYFAIKRFDRENGHRFHYHSFAGMLGVDLSRASDYVELMRTAAKFADRPEEQLTRRIAFNVLALNRDDHIKNHGFLMDRSGAWSLSPAFDINYSPGAHHSLLIPSTHETPDLADMQTVVRRAGFDSGRTAAIVREVRDVTGEWQTFAKQAGVSASRTGEIHAALAKAGRDAVPQHVKIGFDPTESPEF